MTLSRITIGEDRSHEVNVAALCVSRKPPLGNEDPSVSLEKRRSTGKACSNGLIAASEFHTKSKNASSFKPLLVPPMAPPPMRRGKNQCAKDVAPLARAHLNNHQRSFSSRQVT